MKTTPSDYIRGFTKERDEAMLSLDREKILAYCRKYGIAIPENELVLWAGIHKSIVALKGIPKERKASSAKWLISHGFKAGIDFETENDSSQSGTIHPTYLGTHMSYGVEIKAYQYKGVSIAVSEAKYRPEHNCDIRPGEVQLIISMRSNLHLKLTKVELNSILNHLGMNTALPIDVQHKQHPAQGLPITYYSQIKKRPRS
jgi:hypothetical protein